MIGVDLVKISRFEDPKKHQKKFISRFLNEQEIETFENILNFEDKSVFLAKTWAVKEAIFKADNFYSNFRNINLKKVNNKIIFENFEISISHEDDFLVAFVLKKGKND
ncbi:4'-phosphopantetheinyl transferase superfamily protein [Mycoplasmopsis ciconiae]|uniref:4'-phosphopantetheinyl transferase superfamily protein n=1 Tax=Mycoplasmopsis ciconiae TaxID=561067 RepID=A0ABU7MN85_9BACT|nr:4'-phosphopantetheinyl transferase superfamily protein [Mycoplasmopsis ciconiae]